MKNFLVSLVSLLAIVIAALVIFLPQEYLFIAIALARFFDTILPVLAVAALVKYISKR